MRTTEPVLHKYAIKRASLFGSFADSTATADNDIDLLVEIAEPMGLLQFIYIKHEQEDLFGRKVDFKAIKPTLKNRILHSVIPIYGKEAA